MSVVNRSMVSCLSLEFFLPILIVCRLNGCCWNCVPVALYDAWLVRYVCKYIQTSESASAFLSIGHTCFSNRTQRTNTQPKVISGFFLLALVFFSSARRPKQENRKQRINHKNAHAKSNISTIPKTCQFEATLV